MKPESRGLGIGEALLAHLARLAVSRGCGRMEWSVLTWNEPAIGFYQRLGAVPMDGWQVYRLTGDALEAREDNQGPEPRRKAVAEEPITDGHAADPRARRAEGLRRRPPPGDAARSTRPTPRPLRPRGAGAPRERRRARRGHPEPGHVRRRARERAAVLALPGGPRRPHRGDGRARAARRTSRCGCRPGSRRPSASSGSPRVFASAGRGEEGFSPRPGRSPAPADLVAPEPAETVAEPADALTGFANREQFHFELEREIARADLFGRPLALSSSASTTSRP